MTPRRDERRRAAGPARRGRLGFSMVELLIAASLASALLAAGFGWLWTTASLARGTDARTQVATAQAFAVRMARADLAATVGLCPPDRGLCGPTTVALLVREPLMGEERVVTIAWDPRRGVLWRNAPGSYLAEGVSACVLRYFAGDGVEIVPSDGVLGVEARGAVRRVLLAWTVGDRQVVVEETIP